MNKKEIKTNKVLSLILAITMVATMVLPVSVFAAVNTPVATATVVETGVGIQTKTITVAFEEEMTLESTAGLDTDISVSGKTFGTSIMAMSADGMSLVITLTNDSTVAVGDSITFANNVIKNSAADYFNGDVTIGGSLESATIDYSQVEPSGAIVEITGYTVNPTTVGTGSFAYTVSATNYQTKTGTLVVDADDLGDTVVLDVQLEKNAANYTALNAKITEAGAYSGSNYTETSFAALETAIENANNVSSTLKFDEQAIIDNLVNDIDTAIAGLVGTKTVDFTAVAVADDASVNYAKATKIVMVFAEPIADGADILANLSIKEKVQSASWRDTANTVYELVLKSDANLTNGTKITYTTNDTIKSKTGYVLNTVSDVEVIGNLEDASAKVTATNMTATIVKVSGKPGVVAGDKIVFVFNAPIKDNPTTITIDGKTANVVSGTANTVYELTLTGDESYTDSSTFDYGTAITGIALNGTFGTAVAPKALKAYAIDNDGTELLVSGDEIVKNDEIVVKFNVPTNGADDISKVKVKGTGYTASLGASTMSWDATKTILIIKLESNAVIKDGVEIDLKNVGIKDKFDTIGADSTTLVIKVEGSFGYTIQPRITKAVAFTQSNMDYIRVFFNTEVKAKAGEIMDVTISNDFEMGVSANKRLVDEGNGLTYYEIAMAKDEHGAFESGTYTVSLTGIVDKETGSKELASTPFTITGAFISPIIPEVLKVVAISNDGSGVAKAGDKIVAVFNTKVKLGNVEAVNGFLGTGYSVNYSSSAKNVVEIVLGAAGLDIEPGTTKIKFTGFKDEATESVTMTTTTEDVDGNFGYSPIPEIIKATAVSANGSGVPKAGDKIVVVFNTMVSLTDGGAGVYYYEYTLATDGEYNVGDTFNITVWSKATGEHDGILLNKIITGSFGYSVLPTVKSVVLSEAAGTETITVIFDRATNRPNIGDTEKALLFADNAHLATAGKLNELVAAWDNEYCLKITLASTATTTNIDVLNLSSLGIKAADTGAEVTGIDALAIKGSLVPVVKDVRFAGNSIVMTFSTRTNGVANISNLTALLGVGSSAVWSNNNKTLTISLGENYTITNNGFIVVNGMGIYDAFSGNYNVVGQYKVLGSIETGKLTVAKIVAQSTDKSKTIAQKGDTIVIKFNSATNLKGASLNTILASDKVDEVISVAGGNEAAFGTGYTGTWTAYDTFVITLGGSVSDGAEPPVITGIDPAITVGTTITVSGVAFANGEGLMDAADITLGGSFNGREFILTDGTLTRTNGTSGDYRVSVKAENTLINMSVVPTFVCVAYKGASPVSVVRINVGVENTIQPVFEFAEGLGITSAKIYVFSELFGDINSSPAVLAETVEIN